MFVIQKMDNGYYFHENGKIILFEDPNEANAFIQAFHQYCAERLISEQGPEGIFKLHNLISALAIIEADFVKTPQCGVITFSEVKRNKGLC